MANTDKPTSRAANRTRAIWDRSPHSAKNLRAKLSTKMREKYLVKCDLIFKINLSDLEFPSIGIDFRGLSSSTESGELKPRKKLLAVIHEANFLVTFDDHLTAENDEK